MKRRSEIAAGSGVGRSLARMLGLAGLMLTCTSATAVPICTIASGANLSFGSVVALASTPDQTTNSGISFWVNCSADVENPPSLYSSTTPRVLLSGINSIPLALSTEAPGGPELPFAAPGMPLNLARNGSAETVVLYAKIRSVHFRGLPAGSYSATLGLTLEY